MIDRRRIAVLLLLLGAALAVVGSFQDTYRTVYRSNGPEQLTTSTLWMYVTSDPYVGEGQDAYNASAWPVVGAAVLILVAAVLVLAERTAFIGRPAAMAAAGGLFAIVLVYVLQLRADAKRMSEWRFEDGLSAELNILGGTYLLGLAAVIGLAGAVLAQGRHEVPEPEDEDAVVVHQLDDDDDTPPFGIEIPGDEEQETR